MFVTIILKVKKKQFGPFKLFSFVCFLWTGEDDWNTLLFWVAFFLTKLNLDFAIRNLIFGFASRTKPM